jgi:hypothetical protein
MLPASLPENHFSQIDVLQKDHQALPGQHHWTLIWILSLESIPSSRHFYILWQPEAT